MQANMLKAASSALIKDVLWHTSRRQHRWHARSHNLAAWQLSTSAGMRLSFDHHLIQHRHIARAASTGSSNHTDDSAASAQPLPTEAMGKVMSSEANYLRVDIQQLESSSAQPPRRQLLCKARTLLRKMRQNVLVGDRVRVVGIDWQQGRGMVDSVGPRTSELIDPAVANIDHVVLLFGLTQPPFEPQQVTRFLVSIEAESLPITLVLNKADLLPEEEVEERLQQCRDWGYTALAISCETGLGVGKVLERLVGCTAVVAGPSGAGKSSLINALRYGRHRQDAWDDESEQDDMMAPWEQEEGDTGSSSSTGRLLQDLPLPTAAALEQQQQAQQQPAEFLPVGEMSKIGRGKHTTRTVTLIHLPGGGLLADTPGFNMPTLDRVSSAELAGLFPEFRSSVEQQPCRYQDCQHVMEPGCSINTADFQRYEFYLKLLAEVKSREEHDVRALQQAKRQREGATKVKVAAGGKVRHEVRLEAKKHRQVSRRRAKQGLQGSLEEEQGW